MNGQRIGPLVWLGVGVFVGAAAIALAIQLIILPFLLPGLDAGNGLITHDALLFHEEAARIAGEIHREGWDAWRPLPEGQFVVGLMSIIYALTTPEPWIMIPLTAAMHAVAGVLLARLIMILVADWRIAAIAASPFVVFPSAMSWYAQPLKDSYFIVGALLYLLGWALVVQPQTWRAGVRSPLGAIVSIVAGFLVMGLVRNYALNLMLFTSFVMGLVAMVLLLITKRAGLLPSGSFLAAISVTLGLVITVYGVNQIIYAADIVQTSSTNLASQGYRSKEWARDVPLPRAIEERLRTLAGVRQAYIDEVYPVPPGSNIDVDVRLESPGQMLRYLPRALQIGYLSPFPRDWFEDGTTKATTIMRRIAMFEMLIVYAALAFVPMALWRWRLSGAVWMILGFCTLEIVIFTIAMPNLGTLYRVRYAFLMPVVAVGVAAGLANWLELRSRRSRVEAEVAVP